MTTSVPRRTNGMSGPHSYMQISTWIFLPTLVAEFLFVCSPNLPLEASIPITLIFCGLAFLSTLYGYLATVTDVMDTHLVAHLTESEGAPSHPPPTGCLALFHTHSHAHTPTEPESTKYCWVCETNVAQNSMHCKYCNKCVANFDHHCQWLNTCVGQKNYPYFFNTLCSICGLLLIHGVTSLVLAIDILAHGTTEQRAKDWLGPDTDMEALVLAFLFVFLVFDIGAFSLMAQLLLFHVSLKRQKLTTYQFILKDNQRKRDLAKITDARNARRIVAIDTAKREGNTVLAYQLNFGQYCKPCDPLVVEDPKPTRQEAPEHISDDGDEDDNMKQQDESKSEDEEAR